MRVSTLALAVFILTVSSGSLALAREEGTIQLPPGQQPVDVFGPAQVQLLDNCLIAHGADAQAVGGCVANGLLRQWGDYALGRPTRECIEDPKKCSVGRLLTDPKAQLEAWRDRYLKKINDLRQDLQNLIDLARNPREGLRDLENRINGEIADMEAEAGRWLDAVADPSQSLRDLEREARQKVDAALDDLRDTQDRVERQIAAAGAVGQDIGEGIVRVGEDIEDAVRHGRDGLKDLIDGLKLKGQLPLDFDIDLEISAADTQAALDRLRHNVLRRAEDFIRGKPTQDVADAVIDAWEDLHDEFDRLMDEGLLPTNYRLSLPDLKDVTLGAIEEADRQMRAMADNYNQIITGAQDQLEDIGRTADHVFQGARAEIERAIRWLKANGFLPSNWSLRLPDVPTVPEILNGWQAVRQTVGRVEAEAARQGGRAQRNVQRIIDDARDFARRGGDSVIDEGGRFTDNVNKNVIKPVGNVVQSVIDFGKDLF